MSTLGDYILLARPKSWIKNAFVLLPVLFAERIADPAAWGWALLAAAGFCGLSSAVYVFNDIRDRRSDRLHPRKRERPLAAGRVRPAPAGLWAGVLAIVGGLLAWLCGPWVLAAGGAYLLLQAAYSLRLKQAMILDVICIGLGFVLRAVAGAAALRVVASPWLVVCTFTACLFMGFCKRYNELVTLEENGSGAGDHRATLRGYNRELLTHLITLSAAVTIIGFLLYAMSERTLDEHGSVAMVYTLPVFIYGVMRFAMLSMSGRYSDPTELVLEDRPMQFTIALWLVLVGMILVWARPGQWDRLIEGLGLG